MTYKKKTGDVYSRTCIEQKENVKERLIMRLLEPIKSGKDRAEKQE